MIDYSSADYDVSHTSVRSQHKKLTEQHQDFRFIFHRHVTTAVFVGVYDSHRFAFKILHLSAP